MLRPEQSDLLIGTPYTPHSTAIPTTATTDRIACSGAATRAKSVNRYQPGP